MLTQEDSNLLRISSPTPEPNRTHVFSLSSPPFVYVSQHPRPHQTLLSSHLSKSIYTHQSHDQPTPPPPPSPPIRTSQSPSRSTAAKYQTSILAQSATHTSPYKKRTQSAAHCRCGGMARCHRMRSKTTTTTKKKKKRHLENPKPNDNWPNQTRQNQDKTMTIDIIVESPRVQVTIPR